MSNRNRDYKTLGPDQLKRSFLRKKHSDPDAGADIESVDDFEHRESLPDQTDPDDQLYGSLGEYLPYQICEAIRQRTTIGDLVKELGCDDAHTDSNRSKDTLPDEQSVGHRGQSKLIEDIFDHLHAIAQNPLSAVRDLGMDVGELDALRGFLDEIPEPKLYRYKKNPELGLLTIILLFLPFRIRRFDTWEGMEDSGSLRPLLEHLFVRYEVPKFIRESIVSMELNESLDYWLPDLTQMVFFILLAQGAKLNRAGEVSKVNIPPSVVRYFASVPEGLDFNGGLIWSRLRALGIDSDIGIRLVEVEADLFRWSPAYEDLPIPLRDMAIWCQRNKEDLADDDLISVTQWHRHKCIEWMRATGNHRADSISKWGETWFERRSINTIKRQVTAYEAQILRKKAATNLTWDSIRWDQDVKHGGKVYQFRQLLSSNDLIEEGNAMRHCVGSYDSSCKMGSMAIFSVQESGRRIATIAIDPKTKCLRQAYGKANSKLGMNAYQAVQQWMRRLPKKK